VHAGDDRAAIRIWRQVGAPAVGEAPDSPQRGLGRHGVVAAADAEPDGNRALDRHGVEPGVADAVELAAEFDDRLSPQRAEHRDLLGRAPAAVLEGLVERLVLDRVPAYADPEAQAPAAQHVDLRRLLGHERRLPLRQDQDAGRQRDAAGNGREVRHERQRLVHHGLVRVVRQRRMGMELRVGAQDVVGYEQMVVAHRLHHADELADGGDVGSALRLRKDRADLHAAQRTLMSFCRLRSPVGGAWSL
jgi:hypothetical protein